MKTLSSNPVDRREFICTSARALVGAGALKSLANSLAQDAGERPARAPGVSVLNPRHRVPVGIIIDDSTCLVNLNRFAVPQFAAVWGAKNEHYQKLTWRDWPVEIPDTFVRKFGEWAAENGVKGKYSIVPYPACVGRLDRFLPGWTERELQSSLELVRTLMAPNWDLHPEMVSHTRVIDTKTGHPYPECSPKFMENWDWTTGRSVDEMADYLAYALRILKNAGLSCEGITTPGGFGTGARPQLAQGTLEAVRSVFGAEIPHYFRDAIERGTESVAPRVECATGLSGADPRCVVSIVAGTGDWTGGWDNTTPGGADKFITPDLQRGRLVEVIERSEPALLLAHWTGVYWNGQELGFKIFQEVVRRLHARFDNLVWMKLAEIARYWAAKELTTLERVGDNLHLQAPFACPVFTVRMESARSANPPIQFRTNDRTCELQEVADARKLVAGTWCREADAVLACFDLPKGASRFEWRT